MARMFQTHGDQISGTKEEKTENVTVRQDNRKDKTKTKIPSPVTSKQPMTALTVQGSIENLAKTEKPVRRKSERSISKRSWSI